MKFWALSTVRHRASTQRLLLLVVLLVALMAGTLVAGLAVLVDGSERFGLPSALERVDPDRTLVTFDLALGDRPVEPAQAAVDTALEQLLAPVPATRTAELTSTVHEVGQGLKMLVYYAASDTIPGRAKLVAGSWPDEDGARDGNRRPDGARERTSTLIRRITDGGSADPKADKAVQTIPVAIPRSLAREGSLRVGDTFVTADTSGDERTRVLVTGIYLVDDLDDPAWGRDRLSGSTYSSSYVVPRSNGMLFAPAFGPLVTGTSSFAGSRLAADTLTVTAQPDFAGITPPSLLPILDRSRTAEQTLQVVLAPAVDRAGVTTQLADVLQEVVRYRYVTRTGVLIVGLLLVVLALAALLLATRLLAERRFTEQSLMRARGASGRQMLRVAVIEAVLLGAVTALASPPLARFVYLALAEQPAFRRAGLDHDPGLPASAWLAAAGAAVVFVLVLISPLLRRSTTFVEQEQSAARQDRRGMLQRSGLDLGLLVLAGVAYWQLRRYDSPLVTVDGRPRLDPVLVAGPALALVAGALIAVRVVPLISRRMEALAQGGRSIVLPLAAWEIGRRPQRATGAVLLLTLALAIGTFSLAYLTTWQTSQRDQADFQVGTDVRIDPALVDPLAQATAVTALPGARAEQVMPVSRRTLVMGDPDDPDFLTVAGNSNGLEIDVVAGDPATMQGQLKGRTIEPGGDNHALMTALPKLANAGPTDGIDLPGRPAALRVTVRLTRPATEGLALTCGVRALVEDGLGVRQSVDLGFAPADGAAHVMTGVLGGTLRAGEVDGAGLRPPLRLVGWQTSLIPQIDDFAEDAGTYADIASTLTVRNLHALQAPDLQSEYDVSPQDGGPGGPRGRLFLDGDLDAEAGTPVQVPQGFSWSVFTSAAAQSTAEPVDAGKAGVLLRSRLEAGIDFAFFDAGRTDVTFFRWPRVESVPAVASQVLLEQMRVAVGDTVAVKAEGWAFLVDIVAAVPAVPTTGPDRPVLVMDRDLLSRALLERGDTADQVDEWWIGNVPERTALAMAPAAEQRRMVAVSRAGLAAEFAEQPLRVGFQGALWLVIAAATAFAAIGFAMHTTVAVRLRRVEFSQLRALGITRRALTRVVATENLLLCVIGVICGVGLGVLLGWLVGPMVSLAADGSSPFPAVLVVIPWKAVALLAVQIVAILVLVVLVVTRVLRRSVLGSVLRLGDER